MIFRPFLGRSIMAGSKTETRRLVQSGDQADMNFRRIVAVVRKGRYIWKVNDGTLDWVSRGTYGSNAATHPATYRQPTYAVQLGRGKPAIGHIRIVVIRREHVQDITEDGARREGMIHSVGDPEAPFMAFDMPYSPSRRAWISPGFPLPEDTVSPGPRAAFAAIWDEIYGLRAGWIDNPEVWVLGFMRVEVVG